MAILSVQCALPDAVDANYQIHYRIQSCMKHLHYQIKLKFYISKMEITESMRERTLELRKIIDRFIANKAHSSLAQNEGLCNDSILSDFGTNENIK